MSYRPKHPSPERFRVNRKPPRHPLSIRQGLERQHTFRELDHFERTCMSRRGELVQDCIGFGEWLRLCSTDVLCQRFSEVYGVAQAEVHALPTSRGMDVISVTDEDDDATVS